MCGPLRTGFAKPVRLRDCHGTVTTYAGRGTYPALLFVVGPDEAPPLFPLNRSGGFAGYVEDDAVDAAHGVDDAGGGFVQKLVVKGVVVGGHAIG